MTDHAAAEVDSVNRPVSTPASLATHRAAAAFSPVARAALYPSINENYTTLDPAGRHNSRRRLSTG